MTHSIARIAIALVVAYAAYHDDVIPYAHGRALAVAARHAKLLTYDCAHNDCPPDLAVMWRDIADFLGEHHLLGP